MSKDFDFIDKQLLLNDLEDLVQPITPDPVAKTLGESSGQKLKEAVFQAMALPAEAIGAPVVLTEEQKALAFQKLKAKMAETLEKDVSWHDWYHANKGEAKPVLELPPMAKQTFWNDEELAWEAKPMPVTTDGTNYPGPSKGALDQILEAWKSDPDLWELVQQKVLKKDQPEGKQAECRYWLLRVAPEALLVPYLLPEGVYFLRTRANGVSLDPHTKVMRTWYDAEKNQICMILEGHNGWVVPEGGSYPRHEPMCTMLQLDYETPEQLEELLTKDPTVGPGLAEWLRGCFRDMVELGIPTKEG
jgi:hypothetical protein